MNQLRTLDEKLINKTNESNEALFIDKNDEIELTDELNNARKKGEDLQQALNKVSEVGIDEVGKEQFLVQFFSAVIVLTEKNKFILKQSGVTDSKKLTPQKKKITFAKNFITFFRLWNWAILSKRDR